MTQIKIQIRNLKMQLENSPHLGIRISKVNNNMFDNVIIIGSHVQGSIEKNGEFNKYDILEYGGLHHCKMID